MEAGQYPRVDGAGGPRSWPNGRPPPTCPPTSRSSSAAASRRTERRRGDRDPGARSHGDEAIVRAGVQSRRRVSRERRSARARSSTTTRRSRSSRIGSGAAPGRGGRRAAASWSDRSRTGCAPRRSSRTIRNPAGLRPRLPEDGSAGRRGAGACRRRQPEAGRPRISTRWPPRRSARSSSRPPGISSSRSSTKQPTDPQLQYALGSVLYLEGQLDEAAAHSA